LSDTHLKRHLMTRKSQRLLRNIWRDYRLFTY